GFTTALLAHGARRVYAVEVGVGQLLGRLRMDPRVINLEGQNLGAMDAGLIPEAVDVVTMDVGYLSLAEAIPQLGDLVFSPAAAIVALVKPTFELRHATLAASDEDLDRATRIAVDALRAHGWVPLGSCPAPSLGRGGAREVFLHARRARSQFQRDA